MSDIRLTRLTDIDRLMRWRREVIENVFDEEPDEGLLEANRQYYSRHIADDSHVAFVAEYEGEECGCGSICLSEELPSPDNLDGRCAYLMNIYVRKAFRNHGIAHSIVRRLLEEAKKRDCLKIYLETTEDGKPVYSSLGFRDMPDMMKYHEKET